MLPMEQTLRTVHFFMIGGRGAGGISGGGGRESMRKTMAIKGGPFQKYEGKRGVRSNILVKL